MRFVKDNDNRLEVPPPFLNWISTLSNFESLWKSVQCDFKYLVVRNLNQDPLENFFGAIRAHIAHTIILQVQRLKPPTELLLSPHSVQANCEEDDAASLLTNLRLYVDEPTDEQTEDKDFQEPVETESTSASVVTASVTTYNFISRIYVAGYVAHKNLQDAINCEVCRVSISMTCRGPEHQFIIDKEYIAGSFLKPNTVIGTALRKCVT